MFKKKDDGTYRYSSRFWTYVVIASIVIVYIGARTTITADRNEEQARNVYAYAVQTNDCLNQVLATITDRSSYNDDIARVNDRRSANISNLIIGLSTAVPGQDTGSIIDKYVTDDATITADNERLLTERAKKQYPQPSCGLKLPGQK